MNELTLKDIATLAKLVSDLKLDSLKFGELEIKKSLHESKDSELRQQPPRQLSDEELMFAAGAGELPAEIVEAFIRPRRRTTETEEK